MLEVEDGRNSNEQQFADLHLEERRGLFEGPLSKGPLAIDTRRRKLLCLLRGWTKYCLDLFFHPICDTLQTTFHCAFELFAASIPKLIRSIIETCIWSVAYVPAVTLMRRRLLPTITTTTLTQLGSSHWLLWRVSLYMCRLFTLLALVLQFLSGKAGTSVSSFIPD